MIREPTTNLEGDNDGEWVETGEEYIMVEYTRIQELLQSFKKNTA
jgi:hypothetical protein